MKVFNNPHLTPGLNLFEGARRVSMVVTIALGSVAMCSAFARPPMTVPFILLTVVWLIFVRVMGWGVRICLGIPMGMDSKPETD